MNCNGMTGKVMICSAMTGNDLIENALLGYGGNAHPRFSLYRYIRIYVVCKRL